MAHTTASQSNSQSKSKERLADAHYFLQDLAELADWALSDKRWMNFYQYLDWKRREKIKWKKWKLKELKRRKWVETKKIGAEMCTRLTAAGWQMALRDRIRLESKKCKDGVCILVFDIPEKQRAMRKMLRQFIKECGFTRLQHSVWMTEKDVIKPLMLLLQRRNLERWVRVIQGRVLTSAPLSALQARTVQSPRASGDKRKQSRAIQPNTTKNQKISNLK